MFVPSGLPVEPAEVPLDVVLEPVAVAAPVGLIVEDCCVPARAICTSRDSDQSTCIDSAIWILCTVWHNLLK